MAANKLTYVAQYMGRIFNSDFELLNSTDFILCTFDDISEAQKYAEDYYNNACGNEANISIEKNKENYIRIQVKDRLPNPSNQTIERRTLIIGTVLPNKGTTALEDIQTMMMD